MVSLVTLSCLWVSNLIAFPKEKWSALKGNTPLHQSIAEDIIIMLQIYPYATSQLPTVTDSSKTQNTSYEKGCLCGCYNSNDPGVVADKYLIPYLLPEESWS